MSDARDFLDASKRIEEAATEGPWSRHDIGHSGDQEPSSIVIHTGKFDWSAIVNDGDYIAMMSSWDAQDDADAEFIAHARTALPKMRAALEAVLEMHREVRVVVSTSIGAPTYSHGCDFCAPLTGETHYPCPTVQAIQAALAVNDEGEMT